MIGTKVATTVIKLHELLGREPDNSISSLVIFYLFKVLFFWVPKASPDYEVVVNNVRHWHIEIDNDTGRAEREIGFDDCDKPIVFAPTNRNLGLWTDSDRIFSVEDYELVDKRIFNELWYSLKGNHSDDF